MFHGFQKEAFDVFHIPGLDARMEAIKGMIRPELEQLGTTFAPLLSNMLGEEMYFHVAKHARRTVHPPDDTWVAWSASKRGYKALPHFQTGLWNTHLFAWFAIIYESPVKADFAVKLEKEWDLLQQQIPSHFVWSIDHTKPDIIPHSEMNLQKMGEILHKLKTVKKSELLCGITIDRGDDLVTRGKELMEEIESTFLTLKPLYLLAREK